MKAVVYRKPGPPEVLEYADAPEPAVSAHALLVRVHAVGVNPVDWKMRRMRLRPPWQRFPVIPGSDLAGEVVRVGPKVARFRPGDAVFGMLSPFAGGACAEYAALPEASAAQKPDNLTFVEAAAIPIAGLAALQALRDVGRLEPGQRVLVNGASGGVGTFAVQIAKALGTEVTGVTSAANAEFVLGLGADRVLDYRSQDFTTLGDRYDVIFDAVATRSFRACAAALAPRGTYVSTLPAPSTIAQMVVGPVLGGKRAGVLFLRGRGADLDALRKMVEAGKLRPHIDRTFALRDTAQAHALSETGHARGKLVIRVVE